MAAAGPRRTQEMRREATIRKLLDAATDALIELGYADASVQEVCTRAEVSTGGLFRHFPTREALMVAVGQDVARQILERYRREFETLRDERDPVELALRLVRNSCRSRLNQAWYELFMAARTNARLRKALAPTAERYFDDIRALGHQLLPDVAAALGDRFDVLVDTIIAIFDGEVVHRFIFKKPAQEEQRIELLLGLTRLLLPR
ncbi:MAG: TetR/AcrR family transcriptional regulator [bacterium]|nr:TetR/AcrR family transcriptional regulator [bacterium]